MRGLPSEVDVAVIGAGSAGIAAGRRLAEACSANFFSTAHGAYETGLASADATLRSLRK